MCFKFHQAIGGGERSSLCYEAQKAEGVKLGHPKGTRLRINPKCEEKFEYIVSELAKGTNKTILAKKCKVSKTTFYRYLIYKGLHDPVGSNQPNWKENGIYH